MGADNFEKISRESLCTMRLTLITIMWGFPYSIHCESRHKCYGVCSYIFFDCDVFIVIYLDRLGDFIRSWRIL